MNTDAIEQYRMLKREHADLNVRAGKLKRELAVMEKKSVRDRVRGGSGGEMPYTVEGIQDKEYSKRKTALQRSFLRMQFLEERLVDMLDEVETYIAAVPDSERRMIMRLHYQDGYSWTKTARILGEGYTADAIRISTQRYLKEESKKHCKK